MPGLHGMEALPSQPHGGTCDFDGVVVLSRTKKKGVFCVNTIALLMEGLFICMCPKNSSANQSMPKP